jgi:hypothetical protein
MLHSLKKLVVSAPFALALTDFSLPRSASAQTYAIDCAILLCLAGGWPASAPGSEHFAGRIHPADHTMAHRAAAANLALPHGGVL